MKNTITGLDTTFRDILEITSCFLRKLKDYYAMLYFFLLQVTGHLLSLNKVSYSYLVNGEKFETN